MVNNIFPFIVQGAVQTLTGLTADSVAEPFETAAHWIASEIVLLLQGY